jgi:hypothetical protein
MRDADWLMGARTPHCSHLLQDLDVLIFRLLKPEMRKQVSIELGRRFVEEMGQFRPLGECVRLRARARTWARLQGLLLSCDESCTQGARTS